MLVDETAATESSWSVDPASPGGTSSDDQAPLCLRSRSDCGVMPPPEVVCATPTANTSPLVSATSLRVLRLAGLGVTSRFQLVPSKWTTRLETGRPGASESRSQTTAPPGPGGTPA